VLDPLSSTSQLPTTPALRLTPAALGYLSVRAGMGRDGGGPEGKEAALRCGLLLADGRLDPERAEIALTVLRPGRVVTAAQSGRHGLQVRIQFRLGRLPVLVEAVDGGVLRCESWPEVDVAGFLAAMLGLTAGPAEEDAGSRWSGRLPALAVAAMRAVEPAAPDAQAALARAYAAPLDLVAALADPVTSTALRVAAPGHTVDLAWTDGGPHGLWVTSPMFVADGEDPDSFAVQRSTPDALSARLAALVATGMELDGPKVRNSFAG
jgi:hypothetical protein